MSTPDRNSPSFRPFTKNRAMTRARYERLLADLRSRYSWLEPEGHLLKPAPGHLGATFEFLEALDRIFPLQTLEDLVFFSVSSTPGNLLVHVDIKQTPRQSRWAAFNDARNKAFESVRAICIVCAKRLDPQTQAQRIEARCDEHAGKSGLFAEELRAHSSRKYAAMNGSISPEKHGQKTNQSNRNPERTATREMPAVAFVQEHEMNQFVASIESRPKEQQPKLRATVSKMRSVGCPNRYLGTIPDDWKEMTDEFEKRFPNFSEFANVLKGQFSLTTLGDGRVSIPPTLFVGPPGIGKTEAMQWLSNRLALPFTVIDMSTAQSNASLVGSEAFWSNSQPGELFNLLAESRFINPLVLLDELDKAAGDQRFDPLAPLYTLLEQRAARRFKDLSIRDLAIDASHVNWLATANNLEGLSKPILSRFNIMQIQPPNAEQVRVIAANLYQRIRSENKWGDRFSEHLSETALDKLKNIPPREIRQALQRAFASAAIKGRNEIHAVDIQVSKQKPAGMGFLTAH